MDAGGGKECEKLCTQDAISSRRRELAQFRSQPSSPGCHFDPVNVQLASGQRNRVGEGKNPWLASAPWAKTIAALREPVPAFFAVNFAEHAQRRGPLGSMVIHSNLPRGEIAMRKGEPAGTVGKQPRSSPPKLTASDGNIGDGLDFPYLSAAKQRRSEL